MLGVGVLSADAAIVADKNVSRFGYVYVYVISRLTEGSFGKRWGRPLKSI